MLTVPFSARSYPVAILSSVDFRQPEGSLRQTSSRVRRRNKHHRAQGMTFAAPPTGWSTALQPNPLLPARIAATPQIENSTAMNEPHDAIFLFRRDQNENGGEL